MNEWNFPTGPPQGKTVRLRMISGSLYLHPNWEPVPVLELLSVIERSYLRLDVGYTTASVGHAVGYRFDPVTRTQVRELAPDRDGIRLLGAFGWDAEFDTGLSMRPQIAVEYHRFSSWSITAVIVEVHFRVGL